jgi:hypothetical protein
VDLSDDLPPPRRGLFFPVVIATVFLTIIGMAGGIALAHWHNARPGDKSGQSPITATAEPSRDTRPPCRTETQQIAPRYGAQGTLRIVLLLRTQTSAVWICQDQAGKLYYHANRGGEHATWIEGTTALFMPGVQPDGNGGYAAVANDGTTFEVTSEELRIVHKDGKVEIQKAYP